MSPRGALASFRALLPPPTIGQAIPIVTLSTLSFQAVCRPGYGPSGGVAGSVGQQSWSCQRTRQHGQDVYKWTPVSEDPSQPGPTLECVPCPKGHLCAGPAVSGAIIACPPSTFSASVGSDRCHNCPSCCACDPTTGGCLAGSPAGCSIGGVCWGVGAAEPQSGGCKTCDPSASATAWTARAENTTCGESFSPCYLPRRCDINGACLGAASSDTVCSATFERCNTTLGCLIKDEAPNVCLRQVDSFDLRARDFGCRIGGACLPFGQRQSSNSPCRLSSRPALNDTDQCTGSWWNSAGEGECDCAGEVYGGAEIEDAPTSLGIDLQRAHRDGARLRFPSVLDGIGGVWTLASVAAASSSIPLPLQAASTLLPSHVALLKGGAALCSANKAVCVTNAASVSDPLDRTLPGLLCSADLADGEALVAFGTNVAAGTSSLQLRWRPKEDWVADTPFLLRVTLRLMTPMGGWSTEQLPIRATISTQVGGQELSIEVQPSTINADADQDASAEANVRASYSQQLLSKLSLTLPSSGFSSSSSASRGVYVAVSLTMTPLGCGRLLIPANMTASSSMSSAAVGELVQFACRDANAALVGALNTTCLSSFRWSEPVPSCAEIRCRELDAPPQGNWNVSGSVAVGSAVSLRCFNFTRPSHFLELQCGYLGEFVALVNYTASNSTRVALPTCVPDVEHGACRLNATACTDMSSGEQCKAFGCVWCGWNSTLSNSTWPCQPPVPCFDTYRQRALASCNDTYVPPPVVPTLTQARLLQYTLCDVNLTATNLAFCSNRTLQECLTTPGCGICPSERAIATIASRNSTSAPMLEAPSVCSWIPVEPCRSVHIYPHANDSYLHTVYAYHPQTQCPAYRLVGSFPAFHVLPPRNVSSLNVTYVPRNESELSNSTLPAENEELTSTSYFCRSIEVECGRYDASSCNATQVSPACEWCPRTARCSPRRECLDLDTGLWLSPCALLPPELILTIEALEAASPPVPACSASPARHDCEDLPSSACFFAPDCIQCRAQLPDGREGNTTCVYSPKRDLCILDASGAPVNYTLVGHNQCPYPVSNYTAMAWVPSDPPPFVPQMGCIGCDANMSSVLQPLPTMPSLDWVDTPAPPVLEQSVCRMSNRLLCRQQRNQIACNGAGAGCLWCPGAASRPNTGRCQFAPDTQPPCQIGETIFTRACSAECEPEEVVCNYNLNEDDCRLDAASSILGRPAQGCAWCANLGRCYAPRRCTFAGQWQLECDDVAQPSIAPPNTTVFDSCNSEEQPDPFVPERNEVTCMWRPDSGRSCKSQGSVYRPSMCPFYTGDVSDCVNDDTLPFVPACPLELVHGCTSLTFTACSQQANCTWCFEYDKPNSQACAYTPATSMSLLAANALPPSVNCLFNNSRDLLHMTGLGVHSCPVPQGSLLLAELLAAKDPSAVVCNDQQLQCMGTSNATRCVESLFCLWSEGAELCMPRSSCFAPPLLQSTPYYPPVDECDTEAVQRCAAAKNITADCLALPNCQICGGKRCAHVPPSLCWSESNVTKSEVTIMGETQCPMRFTREPIRPRTCTVSASMCLFQSGAATCTANPQCSWCPTMGACVPAVHCRLPSDGLVYGGPCGTGECPFTPTSQCLKVTDSDECRASSALTGVPCEWCEAGADSSCVYAPPEKCVQTLSSGPVTWLAGGCAAVLAALPPMQQCYSHFSLQSMHSRSFASPHFTEAYAASFTQPYTLEEFALPIAPPNVTTLLDFDVSAFHTATPTPLRRPCLSTQPDKVDSLISVHVRHLNDSSTPVPGFIGSWKIGRRTVHTAADSWVCGLIPIVNASMDARSMLSTEVNNLLWPYAEPVETSNWTSVREDSKHWKHQPFLLFEREYTCWAWKTKHPSWVTDCVDGLIGDHNGDGHPDNGQGRQSRHALSMSEEAESEDDESESSAARHLLAANTLAEQRSMRQRASNNGNGNSNGNAYGHDKTDCHGNGKKACTASSGGANGTVSESNKKWPKEGNWKFMRGRKGWGWGWGKRQPGKVPPNCCAFRFSEPSVPVLHVPAYDSGRYAAALLQPGNAIVTSTGRHLWHGARSWSNVEFPQLCSAARFEFFLPREQRWTSEQEGTDLRQLFYVPLGLPYLVLNVTLADALQLDLNSTSSFLFGSLARVHMSCDGGWLQSCLQFTIGQAYFPHDMTSRYDAEAEWLAPPSMCLHADRAVFVKNDSPKEMAAEDALHAGDGWGSWNWGKRNYYLLAPKPQSTEAVCRFAIPPALPVQLSAYGSVGHARVFINGELQAAMLAPTFDEWNSTLFRLPVAEAELSFADSAPLRMNEGAYQVHLVLNATALRPNFTDSASRSYTQPISGVHINSSLTRPWLLAHMSLQSSAILTGWQCRNVSSAAEVEELVRPVTLASEERRKELMEELETETRSFSAAERELLRWQDAELFHDNDLLNNSTERFAPVVLGMSPSARWMSVAERSATLRLRWGTDLSAEEQARDAVPEFIVCRHLISFGHTMLANEVLQLAQQLQVGTAQVKEAAADKQMHAEASTQEHSESTQSPTSNPSAATQRSESVEEQRGRSFTVQSAVYAAGTLASAAAADSQPQPPSDAAAAADSSPSIRHAETALNHPGAHFYPTLTRHDAVSVSVVPPGVSLTAEETSWLNALGQPTSNPGQTLPIPADLPPLILPTPDDDEPINGTRSNSTTSSSTGGAGRRLLWDGRNVNEAYRYGEAWYWQRRTDGRWNGRGTATDSCEWKGPFANEAHYNCAICPDQGSQRAVCGWGGHSTRTWEQTMRARVGGGIIPSSGLDKHIRIWNNLIFVPNNIGRFQLQMVYTICVNAGMEPSFEDRGINGPATTSDQVTITPAGADFQIKTTASAPTYNSAGNGWFSAGAWWDPAPLGRGDCPGRPSTAKHYTAVLKPGSKFSSFQGAPKSIALYNFWNEQPQMTRVLRLPGVKPTFTKMEYCSVKPGADGVVQPTAPCQGGWQTALTPAPTSEFGSTPDARARTARIQLNHHNVTTGHFQVIRIVLRDPGLDSTRVFAVYDGWPFPPSDCAASVGPLDFCREYDLRQIPAEIVGTEQKFGFQLNWLLQLGLTESPEQQDTFNFEIAFAKDEDSALRSLAIGTEQLRLPFTHGGQQRVTAEYHVDIERKFREVPFFMRWESMDVFARVDVDYFPPARDDGEIDTTHSPLHLVRDCSGECALPGNGLSPDADGSKEYEWGVPYGESLLRLRVTDERGDGVSVFNIYLHHRRHREKRIASVLSTLGVLTPAFNPDVYTYGLSMRVNDPTKQLRLLLSQMDLFSNISATLRVAPLPGQEQLFAESLGVPLAISSARAQCGYRQTLQLLPPYGESVLTLNMTADSHLTGWILTTIRIRKVAFQLLALNNSVGVLGPPFHPRHLTYRLLLANAQSEVTLSSTHADRDMHLTWRWQPITARRGSELLVADSSVLPSSGWLHQAVRFSDLPFGLTSVSVQLRAFDGSTTTYTVLLERVELEEISLNLLTLAAPAGVPIQSGQDGFNGVAAALTPEYDPSVSNYTLSLPPGQAEVILRFPVPPSPIQLIGEWRGVPLRPLQKNSTLMLSVTGVTAISSLLRLTFLKDRSVLQSLNIFIVQQLSANAYLGSVWTSAGRLQPSFRWSRQAYVLRLDIDPLELSNGTLPLLQALLRVQDANATLQAAFHRALPANLSAPAGTPPTLLPAEHVLVQSVELGGVVDLRLLAIGGPSRKVYNHSLLQVTLTAPNGVFQQEYNFTLELHLYVPVPEIPFVWASTVQLVLTLQADLNSLGDVEAARQLLATEVSGALGIVPVRLRVLRLYAGSTMAAVRILPSRSPSETTSVETLRLLRSQLASFPGSPLSFGRLSSRIDPTADLQVQHGCMTAAEGDDDAELITDEEACTRIAEEEVPLESMPLESMRSDEPTALPAFVVPLVVTLALVCAAIVTVGLVHWYRKRRAYTRVAQLQPGAPAALLALKRPSSVVRLASEKVGSSVHQPALAFNEASIPAAPAEQPDATVADVSQPAAVAPTTSASATDSGVEPQPSPVSKSGDWVLLHTAPLNDDVQASPVAADAVAALPAVPQALSVDPDPCSPADAGGWTLHSPDGALVACPLFDSPAVAAAAGASASSSPRSSVSPSSSMLTPSPRSAVSSPSSGSGSTAAPKPTVRLRLPAVKVRSPLLPALQRGSGALGSTTHLSIIMLLACCSFMRPDVCTAAEVQQSDVISQAAADVSSVPSVAPTLQGAELLAAAAVWDLPREVVQSLERPLESAASEDVLLPSESSAPSAAAAAAGAPRTLMSTSSFPSNARPSGPGRRLLTHLFHNPDAEDDENEHAPVCEDAPPPPPPAEEQKQGSSYWEREPAARARPHANRLGEMPRAQGDGDGESHAARLAVHEKEERLRKLETKKLKNLAAIEAGFLHPTKLDKDPEGKRLCGDLDTYEESRRIGSSTGCTGMRFPRARDFRFNDRVGADKATPIPGMRGAKFITLVPLSAEAHERLLDFRAMPYKTNREGIDRSDEPLMGNDGSARSKDTRDLPFWALAEPMDGYTPVVGQACPVSNNEPSLRSRPSAVQEPCRMRDWTLPISWGADGRDAVGKKVKVPTLLSSLRAAPGEEQKEAAPTGKGADLKTIPPDQERHHARPCFTKPNRDPLPGRAVITQVHPSGQFFTCVLYATTAAAPSGGASSGPAGGGAAKYIPVEAGRWVDGIAAGALPYSGLPCLTDFDPACPASYADGVVDSWVYDPAKNQGRPSFQPSLFYKDDDVRTLHHSDFLTTAPLEGTAAAVSRRGPFDFVGKIRRGAAAVAPATFQRWDAAARQQFLYDTPFHHVESSMLSLATLEKFQGNREDTKLDQKYIMGTGPNDPAETLVQRLDSTPNEAPRRSPYDAKPNADAAVRSGFEWTHLIGYSLGGAEYVASAIGTAVSVPQIGTAGSIPAINDDKPAEVAKVFGAPDKPLPKTNPQLARNLVLGTYTVNSHMLQAELFLSARVQAEEAARDVEGGEAEFKLTLMAKVAPLMLKHRQAAPGAGAAPPAQEGWEPVPNGQRSAVIMQLPPALGPNDNIQMQPLTGPPLATPAPVQSQPEPPTAQPGIDSWPTWLGGRLIYGTAEPLGEGFNPMYQEFNLWSQYVPTAMECAAGVFLASHPPTLMEAEQLEDGIEEADKAAGLGLGAGLGSDSASGSALASSFGSLFAPPPVLMSNAATASLPSVTGDDGSSTAMDTRDGRRRLLQVSPPPFPSPPSSVPSVGSLSMPALSRLLPILVESPLAEYVFDDIHLRETFVYWDRLGPKHLQPALRINASFSLDRYPFNELGLKGAIGVDVQVSPWYGSQMGRLQLAPQPLHILMRADYPIKAELIGGVHLDNVWFSVNYAPRRSGPSAVRYMLGGLLEFDIPGQERPLTLEAVVSVEQGRSALSLEATVANWERAFGLDWLTMRQVQLSAVVGVPQVYFRITSVWEIAGKTLQLEGVKSGPFIGGGVSIGDLTADDCASMFRELFGGSVAPSAIHMTFNEAFLAVANGPGTILGREVLKGLTIQANMDIWEFEGIDILLSIGSDGFHFRGVVPAIPDSILPADLHIGNITLEVRVPSSSAADKRSSLFLSLDVTYKSLQARGAFFVQSNPSQTLLIASAGPFSLSSLIPGLPTALDITFEKLCLAYLSDSRIPRIPVIYEKFPELVNARIPPFNAPSSSIFVGALISRLGLLDEIFGMDSMNIKMMLSLIIGKTNVIGVNIMVTDVSLGPFKGGSLEFLAILSTPPKMQFNLIIYLDLPNAATRAEMVVSLAIADTLFLSGSLGPANGDVSGPPVWPRPFGIPGLDVYYLGLGVKGIPVAIAVAFKIAFTKTNGVKIVLGGAVSTGADVSNQLLTVEATNVNMCIYFGMLDAVIGGVFPAATAADQICSMFSFLQLDVFDLYFSPAGATIGALVLPQGMSLNAEVSLFGQKLLKAKGAIDLPRLRAQFDMSIAAIDLLGIIELKGKRGNNVTFGFVVAPDEVSIYGDGELSLFKGLRKIGVYLQFGPGLLDFEFDLELYKVLALHIGVHIEFPVPKLPPLNPQAYLNAGAIASGNAGGIVNTDPLMDLFKSFDLSKFKFFLSVGIDSQLLRDLFGMIVNDCLPDMQIFVEAAEAAFEAATQVYEDAKRAAEVVYQGAQQAAMAAYEGAMKMAKEVEKLIEQAKAAVKMAEEGVKQAGEYATKFAAEAEQRAKQTFEASKQLLSSTTKMWDDAQKASVKAFEDAGMAVANFARKIAGGFFNSLLSIFKYHRQTNTLHWHYEYQRILAARRIERDFVQSKSPTHSMALHSSRKLLGFWDLETVFDGIVGALSFIQDKLNEAVDSAEAAIEVVKETAEQQVAAATEFVEEAGAAIEGAIQAGIDGAKDITDAAQGALDQAIKFADGEIIQKAIDAANAAKDLAVTAANAAKNALESAILSANKIYDQAAALFSEATEQLIKWINYLGKGFGNLFEFEYFRFLGDFKKFSKDGILVFEFKVGIWDGAKTFKERVVIDFTHITEFIKKIEDFIFKLPALNICKLLKAGAW